MDSRAATQGHSMSDIAKAQRNIRRDHIRHRLTNLATRLAAMSTRTHGLDSAECEHLERMLTTIEKAMDT